MEEQQQTHYEDLVNDMDSWFMVILFPPPPHPVRLWICFKCDVSSSPKLVASVCQFRGLNRWVQSGVAVMMRVDQF